MKENKKYYFLIILLIMNYFFIFDLKCSFCKNNEAIGQYNPQFANGGGLYATIPECSLPLVQLLIMSGAILKLGKIFIKALPNLPRKSAWAQMGMATLGITGLGLTLSGSWQCNFSFVRDPVAFDDDGYLIGRDDYGQIQKFEIRNTSIETTKKNMLKSISVPYSDYITVCARSPVPFVNMITRSANDTCYNSNRGGNDISLGENQYFDHEDAFLCPEEWRVHNYKYENTIDPHSDITEKNVVKIAKLDLENADIKLEDFLTMKKYNGSLECKTLKIGETANIHNYVYKALKVGPKICVKIGGLVGFIDFSNKDIVGCHYKKPDDITPLCKNSTPIYIKDPVTNQDVLVDYDNKACFSCFINDSCYKTSASFSKAVLPITSNIIECFETSISNVLFGCKGSPTSTNTIGMLEIATKNLSFIGYFVILLYVIIFGIKIALSSYIPQSNEIFGAIFKIGIILFFTNGSLISGTTGIYWLYDKVLNISSGLSSIVLDSMAMKNNICKYDDALYKNNNNIVSYRKNFDFIKPFDTLDCLMFFYLGGYLFGYDDTNSIISWDKMRTTAIPRIFTLVFPFLLAFDLTGVVLLLFGLLILAIVIWVTSLVVLSILFLSILILISPLIIPSILFPYSKGFFDAWLKEIFAYSMITPLLYLYLAIMITSFNGLLFGKTQFAEISGNINGRQVIHFGYKKLDCMGAHKDNEVCSSCMKKTNNNVKICNGCDLDSILCKVRLQELGYKNFLFGITQIAANEIGDHIGSLFASTAKLFIMALIFLTLIKAILVIIAKLTGGSRTLYTVIEYGEDPLATFYKSFKKIIGVGTIFRKAGKKQFSKAINKLRNKKDKNNNITAGLK